MPPPGGSVTIGGSPLLPPEPSESPSYEYSVFIDGDLFLDYSVFSSTEDFKITGDISIFGNTVTIYSVDGTPAVPSLETTTLLQNFGNELNGTGNFLLFSDAPVLSGNFEATGSVYIGDYSGIASTAPVPLPGSIYLLFSGLAIVAGKQKHSKHRQHRIFAF